MIEKSKSHLVTALASLLLAAGTAQADEAGDLKLVLTQCDLAIADAMQYGDRAATSSFQHDPAKCVATVKRLEELGTSPTEVIAGREQFLFKRAAEHCEEYRQWKLAIDGAAVLANAAHQHFIVSQMEPGSVGEGFVKTYVEAGKTCAAGVDKALAAGAPADLKVKVFANEVYELTLPEGKAKWCDGLLAWGKDFKEANTKAKAADKAKLRDKYAKHGIKGDRLELFMEYDDVYWRGKGCEVVDDIKVLKKAPVLFHWLENSDGTHTIRRYKFRGDKLVKTTDRTYNTQAAAYRGCK